MNDMSPDGEATRVAPWRNRGEGGEGFAVLSHHQMAIDVAVRLSVLSDANMYRVVVDVQCQPC